MGSTIARFVALPPVHRRLLVLAIVGQPAVRLALRLAGFRRCQTLIGKITPVNHEPGAVTPDLSAAALTVSRLLRAAERRNLLDGNCLVHALTLWWLLRRCGIDGEICIGVRRTNRTLEAHAWVAYRGNAVDEVEDDAGRFVPLTASVGLGESLPAS
jgi:hypothetical protein